MKNSKIKNAIENEMSDNYDFKIQKELNYQVLVKYMHIKYTEK